MLPKTARVMMGSRRIVLSTWEAKGAGHEADEGCSGGAEAAGCQG